MIEGDCQWCGYRGPTTDDRDTYCCRGSYAVQEYIEQQAFREKLRKHGRADLPNARLNLLNILTECYDPETGKITHMPEGKWRNP
jgi:hypothetical protein